MENKKRINVSGYRGIWSDTLTKEIVMLYTRAFVSFLKGKTEKPTILIGRDGRESGPEIREVILNELKNLGIEYVDGDILPTPTVLFSVRKHGYTGAIIITASHNPIEYNGLKFVNDKGLFTLNEEVDEINKYYEEEIEKYRKGEKPKTVNYEKKNIEVPNFTKEHADEIIKNINIEAIRNKKFKIAVDMINASACVMDPYFLKQLGVEFIPINNIPNGKFGHRPEPLRENLLDVEKIARENNVDIGFVHDPDADRLVIINNKGEVISEENSIALAIENVISKNKGRNIVLNLSTSKRGEDIANKYGSKCLRSKIGEGNVVDVMMANNAIIGGEGNGGIIYPTINIVRDSFVGLALILELMAERNKTITELLDEIPSYVIKKDKWQIEGVDLNKIYLKLKDVFTNATDIDEQDGIRFEFEDNSWIHLRPSNTEPIIRLFGEAKTEERINNLFEEVEKTIK
jgi:phosphomannomutase